VKSFAVRFRADSHWPPSIKDLEVCSTLVARPLAKSLVPTLRICMKLWWELFSVSRNAVGGWFPLALQGLTILLAISWWLSTTSAPRPRLTSNQPRVRHRCAQHPAAWTTGDLLRFWRSWRS